ncbi:hypothetical protein ASD58_09670 [Duganella sp. Root1480D1]|nr:hypothetical protein ASD58_09670 [Duganella sp. Root1480D1]
MHAVPVLVRWIWPRMRPVSRLAYMSLPSLAYLRIMRLVTVMLLCEVAPLRIIGIVGSCEALLIAWQRGRSWSSGAIPSLPVGVPACPVRTPDAVPAWCRIDGPTPEDHGRISVITHGHAQNEERHVVDGNQIPRAVEPWACIPFVVNVNPIQAIVEEVIGMQARRVIHRVAGNTLQDGILDYFDGNVDAGTCGRQHEIECRHRQYGD